MGRYIMDIVDAQIHIGLEGVEPTLAQMEALGIKAALIDEYWGRGKAGQTTRLEPGYSLPNGVWRNVSPMAELASLLHPNRFSYLLRVDHRDPELENIIKLLKSAPPARAIRILPVISEAEAEAFSAGTYSALCEMAQDAGLPVFVFIPGRVELLPRYLENFPRLPFIVDHCGMPWQPGNIGYFDEVLKLASHANVALKWAHAQDRFSTPNYPYDELLPHLRRAINAFGAERVMWASDHSVIPHHSWANLLFYVRDTPKLPTSEKQWILGRSLRTILNWQVS
jgi:L-fuconolactonase